jgi:Lsr2
MSTVKDSPLPSVEAGRASKVIVTLEDDLDGGPAQETVRFGVGGAEYEIDLSTKNARAFRKQLAPYLEHARRAGRGQRRRPAGAAPARERAGDIRAWANEQGIAVSGRGRIPARVVAQYDAASGR